MTNNNKILTVSYGTFSCTLEGFDDSFETMKAIAEYFRDLAADDRYFGSEPPQPDAQMLAKIAEREGARRVEALEHQGTILLKARGHKDLSTAPAKTESDIQNRSKPAEKNSSGAKLTVVPRQAVPEPEIETRAEEHIDTSKSGTSETPAHDSTADAVANPTTEQEQTSPTRTALSGDGLPPPIEPPSEEEEDVYDPASFFSEQPHKGSDPAYSGGYEDDPVTAQSLDSTRLNESETTSPAPRSSDEKAVVSVDNASFAYKLHRIRAVVAEKDKTVKGGVLQADRSVPRRSDSDKHSVAKTGAEQTAFRAEVAQEIADALNESIDAPKSHTPQKNADAPIGRDLDETEQDDGLGDLAADTDDAGPAENLFAPASTDDLHDAKPAIEQDATLPRDLVDDAAKPEAADHARHAQDQLATGARDTLPGLDADGDKDVLRLMQKADQHMEEPEGKTRRNAFAHARAAVAARDIDKSIDDTTRNDRETVQAYKDDLAEVITTSNERDIQADTSRLPPLKLVAEQRVDLMQKPLRGPVAPRRVAASSPSDLSLSDDCGFAEFAVEQNATDLTEVLEAAAAYMTFVERHEQFSRPQLMSRVKQADVAAFSREEGLRAFGQLLRLGKIQKIGGGRFTAAEGNGYKPGNRVAG